MNKLPRIYLDMDGVLVDLEGAIKKTTGLNMDQWVKLGRVERWDKVIAKKNFWHTAPWNPEGKKMLAFVKKYEPHILSAYVEHAHDPNCIPGKKQWAMTNAGIPASKINLVLRSQKKDYAKVLGEPAILIDDYIKNIKEFERAGGIGIQFKTANQVIAELKKLGFK